MNEANKRFLQCIDDLYSVASRVGNREVVLQVGTTLLIVRGSVPELASAWRQFAHLASACESNKCGMVPGSWRPQAGSQSCTILCRSHERRARQFG